MIHAVEKQIALRGQLVNYYIWGSEMEGKPCLLFLHGWRSEGKVWTPVVERILTQTNNFSCIALDLPGFGKSEFPKKDFDVSLYGEIVRELIEKSGLREVTLVGHSFGGRISIKLSADHTELFKKIILVDSAGFKAKLGVKNILSKIAKPFFAPRFMQKTREALYRKIGSEDYIATPKLQKTFLNILNEDLSPFLSKIQAKTLILWGEDDNDTPVSFAERFHKEIPHSELSVLKNAGHYSFLDQPDLFVQKMLEFLK